MGKAENEKTIEERIQECIDHYLDGYCRKEGCTRAEAKEHMMVKLAIEGYYNENKPQDISKDEEGLVVEEVKIGCQGGC